MYNNFPMSVVHVCDAERRSNVCDAVPNGTSLRLIKEDMKGDIKEDF